MPSYGERMRELEHLSDQANWRRNLRSALSFPESDERIRELVVDAIDYEYDLDEFMDHAMVKEIMATLSC